jgi:hypothetical protein
VGPLAGSEVGVYAIHFEGNGAMSDVVHVKAGDAPIVLKMKPRARVAGTVVDASTGRPHPADVTLTREGDTKSATRYTGGEGRFEFKVLRAGSYTLTATMRNGATATTKLQLAEGETNSGIEIRVK